MKNLYGKKISKSIFILMIAFNIFFTACEKEDTKDSKTDKTETQAVATPSEPIDDGKGVGPIKSVTIPATIDKKLVEEGKKIFEMKCSACHNIDTKKVGPALKGLILRRKPEWIMNMIMNPSGMTQKDPTAKKLLGEYMTQMADQTIDEKSARTILEYLRSNDTK